MGVTFHIMNESCELDRIPNGAYCPLGTEQEYDKSYYVGEFYQGLVLEKGEHNYWDDSDFYALYWSEKEQKPVECEYASTRYYGGGSATVDATPEIVEKYNAWKVREKRMERNKKLQEARQRYLHFSHESGLTVKQTLRVMEAVGDYFAYAVCVSLLGPYRKNTMRSAYRKSLAEQVWAWVRDNNPKYNCPLSDKQLNSLLSPRQRAYGY